MDALFDLPAPARPAPSRPARETPPLPIPDLPLSCRWCRGELTGWCRAADALPETGSAVERVIALIHTERDQTHRKDHSTWQ